MAACSEAGSCEPASASGPAAARRARNSKGAQGGSIPSSQWSDGLRKLEDEADLDGVFQDDVVVLYKHSPICGLSRRALREVREFVSTCPELPVYLVNVITRRELSRQIEERTGIRHESPQAIVLRQGHPTWHGSHRGVTEEALARAVEAPGAA